MPPFQKVQKDEREPLRLAIASLRAAEQAARDCAAGEEKAWTALMQAESRLEDLRELAEKQVEDNADTFLMHLSDADGETLAHPIHHGL
jgi:hypothetical protein